MRNPIDAVTNHSYAASLRWFSGKQLTHGIYHDPIENLLIDSSYRWARIIRISLCKWVEKKENLRNLGEPA